MTARMTTGLVLAAALAATGTRAAVKGEVVDYRESKTALQGYLAYDDAVTATRPGVLVVHEWKGHGDYVRRRATMLAELGYVAFACDMYGKGVFAKDHEEAGKLSGALKADRSLMRARAKAGLDVLMKSARVDATRLAAIGYCFGGTTVLEIARAGMPVLGVASFHGTYDTPQPAQQGKVTAKILVCQGGADAFTIKGLPGFEDEMTAAGADWQAIVYSGAVHSFTVKEAGDDPSTGMAYNANADRRSWAALQGFLTELFGPGPK